MKNAEEIRESNKHELLLAFGIPLILLTALLAGRIVWEETALTLREGPQMVGFSLAHGGGAVLLLAPLCLAVWFVAAVIVVAVSFWRRRQPSRSVWWSLGACVLVLALVSLPPLFWQWLLIRDFAKSSHAADLMTYAAAEGYLKTVDGYLEHGVPLEVKNYEGSTAAFTAAAGGSVPVLALLSSKGADLSATNDYGDSPLEAAVQNHHDAAVAFLRADGARQIAGTPEQRQAAAHRFVQRRMEELHQR